MHRFNWWLRRHTEALVILLALAGLIAVIATEPARERAFVTSAERG